MSDKHKFITRLCIFCFSAISFLGLLGWVTGYHILASWNLNYVPMAPVSVLYFLLFAISSIILQKGKSPGFRTMFPKAVATLVMALTLVKISEFLFAFKIGIEELFLPNPKQWGHVLIGRQSPLSALGFFITAFAFYNLSQQRSRMKFLLGYLFTAVIGINFVVVIGYLFGTPLLYDFYYNGDYIIPVPLATAIAFIFLNTAGFFILGTRYFPLNLISGTGVRARLLKVFLPFTVILVVADGLVYNIVPLYININLGLFSSLIALFSVIVATVVIFNIAHLIGGAIDRAEAERRKAEDALKENEARFRGLTEAYFAGIVIHEKGKVIGANSAFAELFGYTVDELIGKSVAEFAAPELHEIIARKIKEDYGKAYEAIGIKKDGSRFYAELINKKLPYQGKIARVTAVRDITERKEAEKADG